jgi:predicted GNAT family acetyltransferase
MEATRFEDPQVWLDAVRPLLLGDEARHDLPLGIASTLIRHPSVYPSKELWAVERAGTPVGAALQTPPHNLVLARPAEIDALGILARALVGAQIHLPGVTAALPEADAFAEAWSGLTGWAVRRVMGQGVYELSSVRDVPVAPGTTRRAERPEDLELILGWLAAFDAEVVPPEIRGDPGERARRATTVFSSEEGGFWLWEEGGRPVSMTGVGGLTPNGIRIGPVFTPPDLRGHGYATTLVASVSRDQLSNGRRSCFLHTDLANPTSNAIYQRIGYERVCDSVVLSFEAD